MESIKFKSGILVEVFDLLKIKVASLNDFNCDCCLTLDEMKITSKVEYDKASDIYMGRVDLPNRNGKAEHGLAFMLSGICQRWKQVNCYYFTGNSVNGSSFKNIINDIINDIISRAHSIGLNGLCVTSDKGAANCVM